MMEYGIKVFMYYYFLIFFLFLVGLDYIFFQSFILFSFYCNLFRVLEWMINLSSRPLLSKKDNYFSQS